MKYGKFCYLAYMIIVDKAHMSKRMYLFALFKCSFLRLLSRQLAGGDVTYIIIQHQ